MFLPRANVPPMCPAVLVTLMPNADLSTVKTDPLKFEFEWCTCNNSVACT